MSLALRPPLNFSHRCLGVVNDKKIMNYLRLLALYSCQLSESTLRVFKIYNVGNYKDMKLPKT